MSKSAVRTIRFKALNADRDTRSRWLHLANQCKRVRNAIWRFWLCWHTTQGHPAIIADYLSRLRLWHTNKRGPKPTCDIECLSADLKGYIRGELRTLIPDLHERPLELTFQIVTSQLATLKSVKGPIPKWMRTLADEDGTPRSFESQPIPFSSSNSIIVPPCSQRDTYSVRFRLDRKVNGDRKIATSTEDEVILQTKKKSRKLASKASILRKIVEGKYKHAGSNLHFDAGRGEWFVSICYRVPQEAREPLDDNKIAYLRPARRRPWWLRMDNYNHWIGGRTGRHVSYVRRQLLTQRWSRQESYDHASSARKGHGRNRAIGKLAMLRHRWQDFVDSANKSLAAHVVAQLVEAGYGQLIYYQPTGDAAKLTFLHRAGKPPERDDPSSWDWSGLASILKQKCQDKGIKLVVRHMGERRELLCAR